MPAPMMRRWETAVALTAVILAAGALLPLGSAARLSCAGAAIVALLVVCSARLRALLARREPPPPSETYAKIERIRAARGPRRR